MLHRIINRIHNCVYQLTYLVRSVRYGKTRNQFVKDILWACNKYGHRYDIFFQIIKKYNAYLNSINENLYLLLTQENDKDTFLRFFLKSFYGINTARPDEVALIDSVYSQVRKIYKERARDYIELNFRGVDLKYTAPRNIKEDETKPENVLMNYYDVAHAFFLTEYEMEGFNPKDGKTILDCGAAYGDTLLLFRVLYPHSKIYSFECVAENLETVQRNIQLNQVENTVIKNAFLYQDSETHVLNNATYRIDDSLNTGNIQIIKTLALDDFVSENNIDDIGLIKFDIEGGEIPALNGAKETIRMQKPLLYIPIYHLDSDVYTIPEFLAQLNMSMRFRIKWTEKKVWGVDCVLFVKFL